ncbi:phospholipid-transporting ATPase IK isoform X1 [Heterocephalus glaber]|uniref:Phospholipid-transporting ATPase n=2 Tax=Heterocephalus glaber TaxID=10181 RepID=A0AAX6Q6J2_HETGA|nr:phospholipid-transporting ATPase IK isoform X1 [Heterocephalus glaber]
MHRLLPAPPFHNPALRPRARPRALRTVWPQANGSITAGRRSPTSMGRAMSGQDLQDDKDTAFTWEVKANNAAYHQQFQEKGFLCWRRRKYQTNGIHTAKYNFFSFLPWNLYEQFHRVSNLYFLFIIILQSIPEISTLPWVTLFIPLLCLLLIRGARDLVDDIGRHRSDRAINNRPCQMLIGKSFKWRKWKDLCVGDVVCLTKDSIVPADLLLLASTEPSSLCYVETADIDGETNLKFRQALAVTHHELISPKTMAAFNGTVVCESPNSRMHQFVGRLEWNSKKYALDIGNLLLRGCKIRNTDACYGLVIYAGFDTKIMKNCGNIHLKRTKIDLFMNKLVVLIFLLLVVVSLALTVGFFLMERELKDKHHYVPAEPSRGLFMESFLVFWAFLILLSVMVPMAMFIISEFIYLGNSAFINWDLDMYYAPHDVSAEARSTSLNDCLGQVQYVFSDKTGTLTQNVMTFKKCCISGRIYGPENEEGTCPKENPYLWNEFADGKLSFFNAELLRAVQSKQDEAVREFWRVLAICHTVMVQEKDNQLLYQAASPDEEALVTAARNFGYVFLSRTQDTITLVELGEQRVYEVLALMDFNSVRKRMSVLVRTPEGSICLYTKGADTVIFERLGKRSVVEANTERVLSAFTEQTLRTLCLAYKEVEECAYQEWRLRHEKASMQLQDRAQALHQVYNDMEQGLQLLGVTAIEDKLQDGVPETISSLRKGNIKVWVLTGDKQETAVNIGFACQLLTDNMLILEARDINVILDSYEEHSKLVMTTSQSLRFQLQTEVAMVISGDFLDQLLLTLRKEPRAVVQREAEDKAREELSATRRISMMWWSLGTLLSSRRSKAKRKQESPEAWRERAFVDLASRCQAVICCRVTPKQKALIVALVKKYQQAVTLAIGDGANDVNMIKTADIGVGLAGQEGMQAVQNSDYALGQFCFLRRLLLVHGRWSYLRACKFLRYFFYKTVASLMAQIWFACYTSFSAQPLYEGWFLALCNLLYSTLPVLYMGLFEQDVSAKQSLQMPELYVAGQKDEFFNYWVFFKAIIQGVLTSLANFFLTLCITRNMAGPNSLSDYQSFSVVVALSSLLTITVEVMLVVRYWTLLFLGTVLFSLGSYAVMTYATQSLWLYQLFPKTFPFLYALHTVLTQAPFLLVVLLNVVVNTLAMLTFRIFRCVLRKLRFREEEVEATRSKEVSEEPLPQFHRESRARRSSYAFSHHEGYANLITQGTSLRRPRGDNSYMNVASATLSDEVEEALPSMAWEPRKIAASTLDGLGNQAAVTSRAPAGQHELSEASLERPPLSEHSKPSPWKQNSGSRAQTLEERPSHWMPFWQKEPAPHQVAIGTRPSQTQESLSEQPMETESGSVERELSLMEWLPDSF